MARFERNSVILPHIPPPGSVTHTVAGPGPSSLVTASPSKDGPSLALHAAIGGAPGTKFPYQLTLGRVESLPLPRAIPAEYVADPTAPLLLQLRASLFDLEAAAFFGRTWVGPVEFDLRTLGEAGWSTAAAAAAAEGQDGGGSTVGERPRRGSGSRRRGERDDEESQSNSSGGKRGLRDGVSRSHRQTNVAGQRLTLSFSDECLFMHTSTFSPYILLVVEFVIISKQRRRPFIMQDRLTVRRDPAMFKPEYLSAGWSYFHMFDNSRNGLDLDIAWDSDDPYPYGLIEENIKSHIPLLNLLSNSVPVFTGSPRVLPFVAPLLLSSETTYPGLVSIAGSSFLFHFSTRPDLRQCCYLWRENAFVGSHDDVPGLIVQPSDIVFTEPNETATVSKIRVSVFPSVTKFEEMLLNELAVAHQKQFPGSIKYNDDGTIHLPEVIERRVHIGLHNTQTFLLPPFTMTLLPVYSDASHEDGFEMSFMGNIELQRYFRNPGLALVFIVEYKVLILTEPETAKKSGFSAFMDRLSGKPSPEKKTGKIGVEKVISIGWGAWTPAFADGPEQAIPLISKGGSNPYSSSIYYPIILPEEYDETEEWKAYATSMGRLATRDIPVVVSFQFSDFVEKKAPKEESKPETERERQLPEQKSTDSEDAIARKPPPAQPLDRDVGPDNELSEDLVVPVAPPKVEKTERRQSLGRSERARLLHAGFTLPHDEDGFKPTQVNLKGSDPRVCPFVLELEQNDVRKQNEVTVTFMGLTFSSEILDKTLGRIPATVFFTYQFFNFPYCTTQRARVYTGPLPAPQDGLHHRSFSVPTRNHERSGSTQSQLSQNSFRDNKQSDFDSEILWPAILFVQEDDGGIKSDTPGITMTYEVNDDELPSIAGYHQGLDGFLQYIAEQALYIHVWDGESQLYVGSTYVDLRPIARQGKSSVFYDAEIEITCSGVSCLSRSSLQMFWRESSVGQTLHMKRGIRSMLVVGKLNLRLVNNGKRPPRDIAYRDIHAKENIIVRDHRYNIPFRLETMCHPKKMVDVDSELCEILSSSHQDRIAGRQHHGIASAAEELGSRAGAGARVSGKLERVKRVKERDGRDSEHIETLALAYSTSRQERQRDLQTIDIFRERCGRLARKQSAIEKSLSANISVTHRVYASFGQAYFFEYLFCNPYNEEHLFSIFWDDLELRLVTSKLEWTYLRRIYGIRDGLEEVTFEVRPDGYFELAVGPNETIAIPFVFQSMLAGSVLCGEENRSRNSGDSGQGATNGWRSSFQEYVAFLNSRRHPVGLLDVAIIPRFYAVDRVFRFFRPENDLIRKTIRYLAIKAQRAMGSASSMTAYDTANPWKRYVRCSNEEVVCALAESGKLRELSFKYRVGPAPETQALYFLFYDDPFFTSLREIWKVFVHSLHRYLLDVTCTAGQTHQASLVLRGSTFTRSVKCFASLSSELLIAAPVPLLLAANALSEIGLMVRPKGGGQTEEAKEIVLNVVGDWLVFIHLTPPTITKSFEITVPKGKVVNKRVSYTNPYSSKRRFRLRTNAEHLVQFKDGDALELDGGESQYIGLRLLPPFSASGSQSGGGGGGGTSSSSMSSTAEILIFLNDEHDKMEECLMLRVIYA
ncbi:hypothetical protein DFJ73DRAFT_631038 [Zopfochytrium polystomum]|nr:hypothetical protein DFJ73DRAFT_631038 [Zopfochytrium polystomum]